MQENAAIKNEPDAFNEIEAYQKPIGEHIKVLRKSILRSVIALALAFFFIITYC